MKQETQQEIALPRGLFMRYQVLYMRTRYQGKLYREKCVYQGPAAFGPRGKVLACVLKELAEWRVMVEKGMLQEKPAPAAAAQVPTLDALCAAYQVAAAERCASDGSPRPGTVTGVVSRVRCIAREMGLNGQDRVDRMTSAALRAWMAGKVAAVGAGQEDQARARYSAWRAVAIARSAWARWTREPYAAAGILIPPALADWPLPSKGAAAAPQFQAPPEAVMARTVEEYAKLEQKNPRLWLAATLGLMFAMRPVADGSRAQWDWFRKRGSDWWLEYTPSKTRGRTSEGSAVVSIRLPAGLYERMRAANPAEGYVVPGEFTKHREDVFARELCAWQRANGWDSQTCRKPAYMLRKLCACAAALASGGNVQQVGAMLGISVPTLMRHYAALFKGSVAAVDVAAVIGKATAKEATCTPG